MRKLTAKRARKIADKIAGPIRSASELMQWRRELILALRIAADALEMGEDSDEELRRNRRIIREHKKAHGLGRQQQIKESESDKHWRES